MISHHTLNIKYDKLPHTLVIPIVIYFLLTKERRMNTDDNRAN